MRVLILGERPFLRPVGDCQLYAESAICRLSLNAWPQIWKYQKFLFLLTNMLRCSEIPHLGYKGRHRRVFFNFVEVDNELLHLVTSPVVFLFFFHLCPVPHCVFKQMWVHLAKSMGFGSLSCATLCIWVDVSAHLAMVRWIFHLLGKLLSFFGPRISKGCCLQFLLLWQVPILLSGRYWCGLGF